MAVTYATVYHIPVLHTRCSVLIAFEPFNYELIGQVAKLTAMVIPGKDPWADLGKPVYRVIFIIYWHGSILLYSITHTHGFAFQLS